MCRAAFADVDFWRWVYRSPVTRTSEWPRSIETSTSSTPSVIGAVLLRSEADSARLGEALDDLPPAEAPGRVRPEEWAYYVGLCVGLRLQEGK